MTPEQIDALPAGRELDALVAEKVMGWTITAWASGEPWGNREIFEPSGRGPHRKAAHVPTYSTDIAAAWEVVKKLDADGLVWAIADDEVYFAKGDPDSPDYRFGGVGLYPFVDKPLAICRAALKALGA
ncbi:MAG TPA: hypothetical protein DCP69_12450 [Candidatus Omnitrophica bacterium]|nr:hypothetical protein [Candidatus Omnitrophota bacterium]